MLLRNDLSVLSVSVKHILSDSGDYDVKYALDGLLNGSKWAYRPQLTGTMLGNSSR
jgi:hypothetical protein